MRILHRVLDLSLWMVVVAAAAVGAAGVAGCERKETIIDVKTPGADIEVERDKSTGAVEVEVDRDR